MPVSALKRMVYGIRRGLFRRWVRRFPRAEVLGVPIIGLPGEAPFSTVVERTRQALNLLAVVSPRLLGEARERLECIVVSRHPGEFYQGALRICILSEHTVVGCSAEELALAVVHETAHARIQQRGIPYNRENRARIEAACVREECDFARKCGLPESRIAGIKARLAKPWWLGP